MTPRWLAVLALGLMPVWAAGAAPPLFAEAELSPAEPFVQAHALYTLRFYQGAAVRDLELVPPAARLADIRPLGATQVREVERAGQRYRLHERRFIVIPFASGPQELTGAHVRAGLPGTAGARRWDAPPLRLNVKPVPAAAARTHWLPAEKLVLDDDWLPDAESFTLGALLRRTVRIEAVGVDAAQLPAIDFAIDGAIVTPRPAQLTTRVEDEYLIGVREQTFDIVPTRPGKLEVPPLEVAWWPIVNAGGTALARLPGRHLSIAGGASPVQRTAASPGWALGMILLVLALAVGIGWLAWPLWRLRPVLRALKAGHPRELSRALYAWGQRRWPAAPPLSLPALAQRMRRPALRAWIRQLDKETYGQPVSRSAMKGMTGELLREVLKAPRSARFVPADDARRQSAHP